ncbi:hypothetical protein NMY22_g7275 [Coprinellus aureogranulatus]|nr:hypothetical protein NMY22_g7275 [Coprinellus aureogranulatus]
MIREFNRARILPSFAKAFSVMCATMEGYGTVSISFWGILGDCARSLAEFADTPVGNCIKSMCELMNEGHYLLGLQLCLRHGDPTSNSVKEALECIAPYMYLSKIHRILDSQCPGLITQWCATKDLDFEAANVPYSKMQCTVILEYTRSSLKERRNGLRSECAFSEVSKSSQKCVAAHKRISTRQTTALIWASTGAANVGLLSTALWSAREMIGRFTPKSAQLSLRGAKVSGCGSYSEFALLTSRNMEKEFRRWVPVDVKEDQIRVLEAVVNGELPSPMALRDIPEHTFHGDRIPFHFDGSEHAIPVFSTRAEFMGPYKDLGYFRASIGGLMSARGFEVAWTPWLPRIQHWISCINVNKESMALVGAIFKVHSRADTLLLSRMQYKPDALEGERYVILNSIAGLWTRRHPLR